MQQALDELKAAKAERAAIDADLDKLNERYAALGRQAQAATRAVDITECEREQKKVQAAKTPFVVAQRKVAARIQAAKNAVAKAAEAEA